MANLTLEKIDLQRIKTNKRKQTAPTSVKQCVRQTNKHLTRNLVGKLGHNTSVQVKKSSPNSPRPVEDLSLNKTISTKGTRYIPIALKQKVWMRDSGKCQFKITTGRRICGSTFLLEIDHVVPFSKSNRHELNNLRLLCSAHNKNEAIRAFGNSQMNRFLDCRE